MIKAPPAHSHSRLSCFESCPLQYKFKYMDKLPQPPADPLDLGAAAHEFFEAYGKHCQEKGLETDLSAVDAIRKDVLKKLKRPLGRHLVDQYNELAQKFAEMEMLDGATLRGIELDIAFDKNWKECSWFAKNAALRMKMDRLYQDGDKAIIRDYKTGYGEGDPGQMRIYAAGAFTLMGVKTCEAEFSYVGTGKVARKEFTIDQLPALVEEIEERCARLADEKEFAPTPGSACQYCPYVVQCTAKPSSLLAITDAKEARQVAEDLFVLEAQVKAKKEALKGYVVQYGDVETKSGRWGYGTSESISVRDMGALISMLELKKIDPMKVLSITGTALKGLYKKNDGLKEDLEPLLDVKISEKFQAMKLKKEEVDL